MTDVRAGAGNRPQRARRALRFGAENCLPATAAAARALVREQIALKAPDLQDAEAAARVLADLLLVTSELVTNAMHHGNGLTSFDLWITGDGLILNVADASTRPPPRSHSSPRPEERPGRRIRLAAGLPPGPARRDHRSPDGKQITVLIRLTPPA
ncbi:hypothetical protein YW3DRAFT_07146 [Streptomyces sp. MnatMP-M77]|nr:hypothetical protein YW3DRAFT_07146 [Streptomyces sp. MnatMP-M77]